MKLVNTRGIQYHHLNGGKGVVGGRIGLNYLPFSKGRICNRYMLQVLTILMLFCILVLFQISLLSIQSISSEDNNALANVGNGRLCEGCDDSEILLSNILPLTNQNNIVGTNNNPNRMKDSHIPSPDFAPQPETSASNYNYLYNDGDSYNDNPEENETETTKSNLNFVNVTNSNDGNPSNGINKSGGGDKLSASVKSSSSGQIKNGRRNKLRENSHYQKRKKLLESVFLSVKTTKRFHNTRLEPILRTWFNLAREQTWIFTDADDPVLDRRTNGHIINTHCPSTHYRQALCCKMSAEFDTFLQSQKSWFCHFDDDNYVNVPALLDLLARYDSKEHWYLGKPSLKSPIHFLDPDNKSDEVSFWFGTGGAGFCLSRALALRMSPLASGGKFTKLCDKIQLPDDVTIGYVAGHLLGQNLTVIGQLHSHFETMKFIDMKNPHPEITFSYVRYADHVNILDVKGFFTEEEDPTRFLSLHCRLFPNFSFCPKGQRSKKNR